MKLDYQEHEVKTNIPNESVKFTIANDPIVYEIFSDKLYTDKFKAIIRELVSNAYDAHVSAGTLNTKIKVVIPTYLDQTLIIRDYGTGLPPTTVLRNLTTFFWSDKRDSNSLIGGLGIGMKSPFCYTDSFVLISYFKGVQYTFSCYKDNRVPTCVLVDQGHTKEPNGLEIIINTKERDYANWYYAAQKVLPWFPNINCNISLPELTWAYKTDNWGILDAKFAEAIGIYQNQYFFLQGNILYPLNLTDQGNFKKLETNTRCVIFTEIGDLSVAVNREALSLDPATTEKVGDLILKTVFEMKESVNEQIEQAANPIAAIKLANQTKAAFGLNTHEITYKNNTYKLHHIELPFSPETRSCLINKELKLITYQHKRGRRGRDDTIQVRQSDYRHESAFAFYPEFLNFVGVSNQPITIQNTVEYLKHILKPHQYALTIQYTNQEALASLIKDCYNFDIDIVDISHLHVSKAKRLTAHTTTKLFKPTQIKRWLGGHSWADDFTNEHTLYYTIPFYKGTPQLHEITDLNTFYNLLTHIPLPENRTIIGIPATTPKKLYPPEANIKPLEPTIIEVLSKFNDSYDKNTTIQYYIAKPMYTHLVQAIADITPKLNKQSLLKSFIEEITTKHNINTKQLLLHELLTDNNNKLTQPLTLKVTISEQEIATAIAGFLPKFDELKNRYPILATIFLPRYQTYYVYNLTNLPRIDNYYIHLDLLKHNDIRDAVKTILIDYDRLLHTN